MMAAVWQGCSMSQGRRKKGCSCSGWTGEGAEQSDTAGLPKQCCMPLQRDAATRVGHGRSSASLLCTLQHVRCHLHQLMVQPPAHPPLVSPLCRAARPPPPLAAAAAQPAAPAAQAARHRGPPPAVVWRGEVASSKGDEVKHGDHDRANRDSRATVAPAAGADMCSLVPSSHAACTRFKSSPPDREQALDRTGGTRCGSSSSAVGILLELLAPQRVARLTPSRCQLCWRGLGCHRRRSCTLHSLDRPPHPLLRGSQPCCCWPPRRQLSAAAAAAALMAASRPEWCAAWPGIPRPAQAGQTVRAGEHVMVTNAQGRNPTITARPSASPWRRQTAPGRAPSARAAALAGWPATPPPAAGRLPQTRQPRAAPCRAWCLGADACREAGAAAVAAQAAAAGARSCDHSILSV